MNTLRLLLRRRYDYLTDKEKKILFEEGYSKKGMSWIKLASYFNKSPNTLRRDAKKLGVRSRTKSEAQSIALREGRHKHPTKGTKRPTETKVKISESISKSWANLSDEELEYRRQIGRDSWESKTEDEIREIREAAGDAVRRAAVEGSKLEHFLKDELIKNGYQVKFHVERIIRNERLQIDLLLPIMNVAIEVDGPSHFKAIWGEEVLARNQKADKQKDGLLLSQGMAVIRVRQTKSLSEKYKRDLSSGLIEVLESIKEKFPPVGKRVIVLGDKE